MKTLWIIESTTLMDLKGSHRISTRRWEKLTDTTENYDHTIQKKMIKIIHSYLRVDLSLEI